MVTSEKFTGLISVIVGTDLEGVIAFLRSEGVNVSLSAKPTEVTNILVYSLANSEVLKQSFVSWADSRYQNQSNYSGESYASGFDPMATQGSGQEFDAMSSQQGANLNDGGFSNASGEFNPMDSQSGGFSPMETQHANFFGGGDKEKSYQPYNAETGTGGSTVGNFLRGDSFKKIVDTGLGFWKSDTEFKQQQKLANAGLEAERLRLEQLREQGKLTQQQFDAQYQLAKQKTEAPTSTIIFWVIGGVVLLGALGTTIYFATRKK